mmetsp:Transcript_26726/g.39829  ORF Transcript_26726/g.39829 Transcript_26726/m.39829 type:complete len:93 (+) Transcript_26726:1328-1606(+)
MFPYLESSSESKSQNNQFNQCNLFKNLSMKKSNLTNIKRVISLTYLFLKFSIIEEIVVATNQQYIDLPMPYRLSKISRESLIAMVFFGDTDF